MLEVDGPPCDSYCRHKQRNQSKSEDTELGNVALYRYGVVDRLESALRLRLDAQVVPPRGYGRHGGSVMIGALGPGAIGIAAGIKADFAAEVVGLPGIVADERVIQINPGIAHGRLGRDLDIRGPPIDVKYRRDK
jgi:hypothetical protein